MISENSQGKPPVQPGDVFGRWMVLDGPQDAGCRRRWLCRCACGTERYVLERSLRSGGSTSCGCRTRK